LPYAPLFDLQAVHEIPSGLLAQLRVALRPLTSGAFDAMAIGQRCQSILRLVQILVAIDKAHLAKHPEVSLYASGVVYRKQQTQNGLHVGMDLWWSIPTALQKGEGSCEDLASWRVAEQQLFGNTAYDRSARPRIHSKEVDGLSVYHVVVAYADGQEEDPSYLLGMRPAWTL
jgi:hypothetical protein